MKWSTLREGVPATVVAGQNPDPPDVRPLPNPGLFLPRLRLRGPGTLWTAFHLGLLLAAFELYHAVTVEMPGRRGPAHAHAATLIHLEQWLHILVEPWVQRAALHHAPLPVFGGILGGDAVRHAAGVLYSGGQMPWLASMLLWLFLFRRAHFARVAQLTMISSVLAILISAIYPVAPPRFAMAGAPFRVEDVTGLPISEQALARLVGFHPYTSLPSVHVLWALLTGLGLFLGARHPAARLLAAAFPVAIVLSVVVTGNHYVLDCVASFLLLGICIAVQWGWQHRRRRPVGGGLASRERDRVPRFWAGRGPLVLCACTGMVLVLSPDHVQRLIGLLLLCISFGLRVPTPDRGPASLSNLGPTPTVEWWCGMLLVTGATTIGAAGMDARLAGSLFWIACGILLLLPRLRLAATPSRVLHLPDYILHRIAVSTAGNRRILWRPGYRLMRALLPAESPAGGNWALRILVAVTPFIRAVGRGAWRALHDVAVLVVGYELYLFISANLPRRSIPAHANAATLIQLEQRLHIFVEPEVQHAALHHAPLPVFGGILGGDVVRHATVMLYAGGHLPWLVSVLFWLYLFRRDHYYRVRNVVILSTLLAIIFAAIYPVAPPRFALAGMPYGIESVTGVALPEKLTVRLVSYDPYASLPSIHTLWALLTGLGLFLAAPRPLGRILAIGFPVSILGTVVITGNHYLLDCLASATLLGLCLLTQWAWERVHPYPVSRVSGGRGGREQRRSPNLRPLDYPLVLCACIGVVLGISADPLQRILGLLLLAGGAVTIVLSRRRVLAGIPLRERTPWAEWWSGLLFAVGATTIGTGDPLPRLLGSLLWLVAAALLLIARQRLAAHPSLGPRLSV